MSYSGYKSSPRGSRGGYRGGGGGYRGSRGGEGGGWRGSSRGYAGSSRGSGRGGRFSGSGGGKWERDDSGMYESRSRYSGGGGDRTSSHSREDGSYRYRGDDSGSYSSREHSHRGGSPDRKRMRADYSPASSMHRSHDYDGMEYPSRSYGGYEGKRMSGYGGDERRVSSFREERERIRSDDYQFRKPLNISGPRHSTPRGTSYRGRSTFSRGFRSSFRRYEPASRVDTFVRKRSAVGSYGLRKPIGRSQEYLRRLKLYRIERLRRLRARAEKEGSDDDEDEEGEEEEVEEEEVVEEEVTDEDGEGQEKDDDEKTKKDTENEDEEMEVDNKKEDKKKKTVKKVVKVVKKIKRKIPKKKEDDKEKDESGENKDLQVTVKQDSEGRDVDGPVRKNYLGQPFMKLECPHCLAHCETFKEYMLHLAKSKHQIAMAAVGAKVSRALGKLRMEQRAEQKDIDEEAKLKNPNMRTFFCLTCKLNFRSLKSEHLRSQKHKEIVKFLNPYCKVCRMPCKSPMQYENHICTLFHLKRKAFYEKKNAENAEGSEINMDNFMVLDQVGSGEDEESGSEEKDGEDNDAEKEAKEGEEGGENEGEKSKEKKVKKKKKQINLGSEYCKKINVYFCELCKTFLPRIEDQEQALAVHCRGSMHLRCYVKKKDDLALRKRAERIHRMREAQRKAEQKDESKDEAGDEEATENQNKIKTEEKSESEDKPLELTDETWGAVSEDLRELMTDSDKPTKMEDSDDEEDSRTTGRRYDRFKHSEKTKGAAADGENMSVDEKGAKAGVVNGDEEKDV
ncbi:uncharacterized protein LOC128994479 isoform X2 [Macrosteles quadrilineatus]|uniref:uncharacterized protein LOC128994479 isoform X2 n=1 Tax=Macrosteles quadrilineatus TaxID=74068 RepID=UPI0023E1E046|nr:uncharacterized protein LOC128994479 isoform X2 [Macrosteles quadrilineatus]